MELACSAAVRGSGANKEYAHHVLNLCAGDVKVNKQVARRCNSFDVGLL